MPVTLVTHPLAHRARLARVAIPLALASSVVGLVLVLVLASAPGPSADRAAGGDILVSLDGTNWSTTLPLGLFSGVGKVVPGDRLSRTLWIDNTSSSPAVVRLSRIETDGASSLLSRAISLTATAHGANGFRPTVNDGSCALLLLDEVVGAEQSTAIIVTLTGADLRADEAQGQAATITLVASMTSLGRHTSSPCPAGSTNVLTVGATQTRAASDGVLTPSTAGLSYPAIMIASLLTGVALFTHLAARRRRYAE